MPEPAAAGTRFGRIVAVIPIRNTETAKSRLGEALDAEEREDLVVRLLRRTIDAARQAPSIGEVVVVSPDARLLELARATGCTPLVQRSPGLGAALAEGRSFATARGATGMLILPADLPAVTPALVEGLVDRARELAAAKPYAPGVAVLVPDRRGEGTNALLLVPPDAAPLEFGPASRARHRAGATAAGTLLAEVEGPLSLDLDLPEDLLAAEAAGLLGVEI